MLISEGKHHTLFSIPSAASGEYITKPVVLTSVADGQEANRNMSKHLDAWHRQHCIFSDTLVSLLHIGLTL